NMKTYRAGDFEALVVDSAGCGAHLKDFYPELKGRVKDLTEWLAEIGLPSPARDVKLRVTYQDACHLAHAQRIKKQPRDLIRSMPGVDWVEMRHADICCGAAGLYSTLEPEMSSRILQEKLDDLLATASVTLSGAPSSRHRSITRSAPRSRLPSLSSSLPISSTLTPAVSTPSLHTTTASPSSSFNLSVNGWICTHTSTARVSRCFNGWLAASSGLITPSLTCSAGHEWSCEMSFANPLRKR